MVSKSFLTDSDVNRLERLERLFVWFRRGGWAVLLLLWLLVAGCLGLVVYGCVRDVNRLATRAVPAKVLLLDSPGHSPVTGPQASASLRFTIDVALFILLPIVLLIAFFSAYMIAASSVAAWRTIKALCAALSHEASGEKAAFAHPFLSRPLARGRQKPPSTFRLSGKPWLLPDERAKLYRSARKAVEAAGRAKVIFAIMIPAVITLSYVGPVCVALATGAPWYYGYMRLLSGYEPTLIYHPADLILVSFTARYFINGSIMVFFALGTWLSIRRGFRARPTLIAEMRRLDVLLWRKSQGKSL